MFRERQILLILFAVIYGTRAKTVTLDLNARSHPVTLSIPKSGWPGVSNVPYALSGKHSKVVMAAWPWDLYSETAKNKEVQELDQSGWIPGIDEASRIAQYMVYNDYLIVPHKTVEGSFAHSPSYDKFAIGLNRKSPLWESFPRGATFCEHTQTLYLEPHKLTSCLGKHIATMECSTTGPLLCKLSGGASVDLTINGKHIRKNQYNIEVAPFDYQIEMGVSLWPACLEILNTYYYNSASVTLGPFPSGQTMGLSGRDIVPADLRGESRLTRNFLYCNETYLDDTAVSVGILRTGTSFYYSPQSNTLEIYTTRKNTMKNTWEDV
tara:strand:- start:866 stop:1834 length:969 start_codon:yes stop_codon:yes gene_type:complete